MKNTLWLGAMSLWICATASAHDGNVNISGSIQDNTCTVATDSQALQVPLGNIPSKQFTSKGVGSQPAVFVIDLQKCGTAAAGVSFTFTGAVDTDDNGLLALDGSNHAGGIGVEIQDADHVRLPLNQTTPVYTVDPNQADNKFTFYARYLATADSVTSGDASASATFSLTWQ
ncbi:fimbrial protein [Salmonella enterica subsp. salamae]|nr:fimbrial protein [Salmonella enterica subsp. salamae]ECJ2280737.1 fimbrial protein [Salmonella enterica subsp. salamae]HCC0886634.1 fimbrial protein [Salmonella enterica]